MAMSRAERRRAEKLAKKGGNVTGGPVDPDVLYQLAADHYKAGRLPNALDTLEKLIKQQPQRADIAAMAGTIALDLEKFESAAQYFQAASDQQPDNTRAAFGLAVSQKALGHFDVAAKAAREAVRLSKKAPEPVRILIQLLWALGETADIPGLCRTLLSHEPHNIEAAMFEGMALYHQGRRDEARAIFGYDDLVEIHDLEAPDGYNDMAAFNKALADHIVDHPTMAVPDKNHPTYHNNDLHITRELIGPDAGNDQGPVNDLETMIKAKINDYLARKKSTIDHDFFKRWPKRTRLTAWGTLLKGQGNLVSHIHLEGYLGMVYYPDLPAEMHSDAANNSRDTSGFLELGHPPDDFPVIVTPDTYTIQPKEGRLVIFPGYFFHRTVPFNSKDRRISIAFDVVAEA